ncbi:SIR2 family NAD-dependent protein deacylase [Sorangium sp. So ce131]|uniref:SIR2 family NAD-dependent protein deacylase n=1 Tax=Sorangium sp. So ce131 TaxID=3133282 RepID=UPI003F6361B1
MIAIPKTLEDALRDRFIVPFVGAGVSMAARDRNGKPVFPSWGELLLGAAARLREDGKRPEANVVEGLLEKRTPDYFEAARHAREGLGPGWYRYLRQVLDPPGHRIDAGSLSLARAVWQLPSKLVITTNYDQVLRHALDDPNDLVQLSVDATAELSAMLRDEIDRPTVWHLHGFIQQPQRLILTPDGYRELYPSQEDEVRYRAALQALRHLLAARTFLFIGFSLDDAQFGDQIAWVQEAFGGAAGPHYMLVRARELRDTQRRLRDLSCIEFLTFEDFGAPLVALVQALGAAGNGERYAAPPPAAGAPLPPAPLAEAAAALRPALAAPLPFLADAELVPPPPPRPAPRVFLADAVTAPPPAPATPQFLEATAPGGAVDMALVRQSYRLVHQYQRRLFDRLTALSDALAGIGVEFQRWDPTLFSRHAKSSSEFFRPKYWAWDFLPAYRLQLLWQSSAKASRGVALEAVSDTGFTRLEREEPDPGNFGDARAARSELQISLMRSPAPNVSWNQVWSSLSEKEDTVYDGNDHELDAGGRPCTYRYLHVDLGAALDEEVFGERVINPVLAWLDR